MESVGSIGLDVIMVSGSSTDHPDKSAISMTPRYIHGLRQQSKPLTSRRSLVAMWVTDINQHRTLAAVGQWTQTWFSAAAWARHHHSLRWWYRLLLSPYSSQPLHLQFLLSPQCSNRSACVSLTSFSSLHHAFAHHSGMYHEGLGGVFCFFVSLFWFFLADSGPTRSTFKNGPLSSQMGWAIAVSVSVD